MTPSMLEAELAPNDANHVPLSPLSFLKRAAHIYPERDAVIHGARRYSYRQLHQRSRRLASALERVGVQLGDRVAVLAPNVPELLEAHYGVPGTGAVLVSINIRLEAQTIAFILRHSAAKVLICDREFGATVRQALAMLGTPPLVIDIDDTQACGGELIGELDYESFLAQGDPARPLSLPDDEWQSIALNYTSGTTGDPKGVVLHHRGAYLNACAGALAFQLGPRSVYLWTLPMFHCNGWSHTWAVSLSGGTHVCLRKVQAAPIYAAIAEHGVTHMSAAPIVMSMLIHAEEQFERRTGQPVAVITGGAAPPSAVIAAMETRGFSITHAYGMTESYGPSTLCLWQPGLDELPLDARAQFMGRQGVAHPMLEEATVLDVDSGEPVPADGATLGELVVRGNTVMKGYLNNPEATRAAFAGGWLHTGDLAVLHEDGYVEIKDRSKDIIISGGENISSLEIEEVLYQHPGVIEAAVVARPDPRWGETPHAFVTLRADAVASVCGEDLILWCRERLAHFKAPRHVSLVELPKTATGKIQKFVLREWARRPEEVTSDTEQ
ncbi:Long-chain-fatty-acid--CoA ligase [Stutzerimonas frequens]|jgi:fatty-acyl-CoA synthase|uniref:Acyl-CoA synthetase n=1 Tax=Stutzerimonas stutzeri TaxID=316 RepID=A0AA42H5Q1_STUST|nr:MULTISPECIES: acyl-CoA synthetase [Pseudomonadaceae]MCH2341966.1 acyl-CoA synthetase [Pseudomonas sp.]MBH3356337.1 acyl-CoA synthetase [Stutzerimonas stutzeri]MBH3385874.1 acyl-CoA synthetase [Pseudomonas juntendi]MDH0146102.1 acyl-CoA synthetase [Stutzerimonas stutzeri]MDH0150748.1 acyl-CoA synthetase [Stutzerimonas stutzeri]|tara:strand:- start:2307 stop:3965 length:1659 start_codon:yes stop_codon:yes gene_type:complete